MSYADILSPVDLPPPSARPVPYPNRGDGWNILADVEVFIFAVEAELEAMDRPLCQGSCPAPRDDLSFAEGRCAPPWTQAGPELAAAADRADLDADLRGGVCQRSCPVPISWRL